MTKSDYPSVLLIYTGGTIGMIENPTTGALEAFNFDQLLENVPELKRFNYHISSYQFKSPIDSSDMEPSLWSKFANTIYRLTTDIFYQVDTYRAKWITGQTDIDDEWDDYLKKLESLELDKMVSIMQSAYDSYLKNVDSVK